MMMWRDGYTFLNHIGKNNRKFSNRGKQLQSEVDSLLNSF